MRAKIRVEKRDGIWEPSKYVSPSTPIRDVVEQASGVFGVAMLNVKRGTVAELSREGLLLQ